MILRRLELRQFRNLEQLELAPSALLTVICGPNGQGKTNLLEAVWMLSGAKSFRAAHESELILRGQTWAKITGEILREAPPGAAADGPPQADKLEILLQMDADGRRAQRTGKKNGAPRGRAGNLAGEFPCVVFAPGHIAMVYGPPEGRRRFVDAALCQLYPGYLEQLRRYTRTLMQKNAYLRACRTGAEENGPVAELLDTFDEQLAAAGCQLAQKRREYIEQLAEICAARYEGISSGRERLCAAYQPCVEGAWRPGVLEQALADARAVDIRAGFCTAGIHRDDLAFRLDGEDARVFSSQGQRRSIALSAKMAELELAARVTGTLPVLLLDDVLSELDAARQDYLLNRIQDKQVFITCCSPELFTRTGGHIVTLEGGRLQTAAAP